MKLTELIERAVIDDNSALIAINGGGGKSTLLSLFGRYMADKGKSVLITTSTRVQSPLFYDWKADRVFRDETGILSAEPIEGTLDFYADVNPLDMKKVMAPRLEVLEILSRRYDVVLYEADGSRGLPLKIHTERDPVMIDGTTAVIAIMGAQGIGEKAYSVVFGDGDDRMVDENYMQYYFRTPEGMLKGMEEGMKRLILINAYDAIGDDKKEMLDRVSWPVETIFCSERNDEAYKHIQ